MKTKVCWGVVYDDGHVFIDSRNRSQTDAAGTIEQGRGKAKTIQLKVAENKLRSPTASALLHVWCQQLSGFTGNDVITQKAELKIHFGYPILRDNPEMWPKLKKLFVGAQWQKIQWPEKIEMSELIPCTSIMTTAELKLMMENIKDWAMNTHNVTLDNGKR